jgi:TrmH family RNA methyltransferase
MTEPIKSPANEKLKLVRKLQEGRGRARQEAFATEGEDLLEAGLAAGRTPRFVLWAAAGAKAGSPEARPPESGGAEALPVAAELLARVSTLGSGTRVITVWDLPADEIPAAGPCVYLDGVSDPGNVGTIVRSAAALCGARVVLGPGSADPYSPKAVRAAMGAVHSSPPAIAPIAATPAPRLGLAAHGGAGLDEEIARLGPATLVLGAEREGLTEEALAACDGVATIPLAAGSESLNVAATAAIALQRISSIAASDSAGDAGGGVA